MLFDIKINIVFKIVDVGINNLCFVFIICFVICGVISLMKFIVLVIVIEEFVKVIVKIKRRIFKILIFLLRFVVILFLKDKIFNLFDEKNVIGNSIIVYGNNI